MTSQSHRVVEIVPPFNAQDLRSAEHWHQVDDGAPLIVGRMLPLSGDFYQQATHEVVQGRSVYHLELTAPATQHYTAPRHISFLTSDLAGVSQFEQKKEGSQVTLSWHKPVNRQLISQLTLSNESEAQAVAPLKYPGLNPEYKEVYLGVR